MTEDQLNRLAELTRGKGQQDFIDAINDFTAGKQITPDKTLHSNTCDCITGVWSEHLLKKNEYAAIINTAGFRMEYTPGYWDTHYSAAAMNILAAAFNKIILLLGKNGIILSPFVNVSTFN